MSQYHQGGVGPYNNNNGNLTPYMQQQQQMQQQQMQQQQMQQQQMQQQQQMRQQQMQQQQNNNPLTDASDLWGAINLINQEDANKKKAEEEAKLKAQQELETKKKKEAEKNKPFEDPFTQLVGDIDGITPSTQPQQQQQQQQQASFNVYGRNSQLMGGPPNGNPNQNQNQNQNQNPYMVGSQNNGMANNPMGGYSQQV